MSEVVKNHELLLCTDWANQNSPFTKIYWHCKAMLTPHNQFFSVCADFLILIWSSNTRFSCKTTTEITSAYSLAIEQMWIFSIWWKMAVCYLINLHHVGNIDFCTTLSLLHLFPIQQQTTCSLMEVALKNDGRPTKCGNETCINYSAISFTCIQNLWS